MKSISQRILSLAGSGFTLPALLLIYWQLAIETHLLDTRFWASPGAVFSAGVAAFQDGSLMTDLSASLQRDVAGFLIGSAVGLAVGGVLGRVSLFAQIFCPLLNALKQIAVFAWIPLLSIWLGTGETAKISFIALVVFFPVFLNTLEGVATVDPRHLETASVLGLSAVQRIRRVVLPAATPSIATGIRLGLIYGWLATVGAEYFFEGGAGIGSSMLDGRDQFRMDLVILGMIMIGIVGFTLTALAGVYERRILRWQ